MGLVIGVRQFDADRNGPWLIVKNPMNDSPEVLRQSGEFAPLDAPTGSFWRTFDNRDVALLALRDFISNLNSRKENK